MKEDEIHGGKFEMMSDPKYAYFLLAIFWGPWMNKKYTHPAQKLVVLWSRSRPLNPFIRFEF